jgi:hypothetical protein
MVEQWLLRFRRQALVAGAAIVGLYLLFSGAAAPAYEYLGTGTASLIGNDLTDVGDDGDPEADINYDAVFDSSDEPGFGGGEFAFNVFDNRLGPSNDKWCCGRAGGAFDDDPVWVSAQLPAPHFLTSFTVSSANDVPERDPILWALQGSNDGQNYVDIYNYEDGVSPWDQRLQVILFGAGDDFPVQTTSYEYFRFATFDTVNNPNGAYFQVGEIELFGDPAGEVPPIFVGGENTIGTNSYTGKQSNQQYGPPTEGPGLAQEWYQAGNPGNKDGVDVIFEDNDPVAPAFRAGHGSTWWTGNQAPFGDLVQYPDEVQPPLNGNNNDNYTVRATGELFIPESGTYRFSDGVDDYTYWAVDIDKSGVAGDSADEVLIDDNAWTSVFRDQNNGGQGLGEADITVAPGGEWLAVEFNMAEGGGDDAGIIYWDFNPDAPAGQQVGGAVGFPELDTDPIDPTDAEQLYIPDTFLRSTTSELVSADLSADVATVRAWQFDVNGDTDTCDQFVVENPDPNVFTTILNVDGVTLNIKGTGSLANGDSCKIIDADQVVGTPIITSAIAGQTWTFNPATGSVIFGIGVPGDFNNNGILDSGDIDDLTMQSAGGQNPAAYDLNGDQLVNGDDVNVWISDLYNSYSGDLNLDKEFNSGDLVNMLAAGTYETGQPSKWSTGDFNGDGVTNSGDLVTALAGGGYEQGPKGVAAVPEPSSLALILVGMLAVRCRARRRT